jgi:hypothetical protein
VNLSVGCAVCRAFSIESITTLSRGMRYADSGGISILPDYVRAMRHFGILSFPGTGHLHLLTTLARELMRRGH